VKMKVSDDKMGSIEFEVMEYSKGVDELIDTVWLACAVDGEGYIGLEKPGTWYVPEVSVANTSLEFMEKVAPMLKTNLIPVNWWRYRNNKLALAARQRSMKKIREILSSILPFLIIKRRRAELLIEYCQIRESMTNTDRRLGVHDSREYVIYSLLKMLNKKGRV